MISRSPRRQNPEDYAELLEESGVKAQARAPMTPIVKLVFGIDYDKARLTEFAAALSFAQRERDRGRRFRRTSSKGSPAGSRRWSPPSAQARRPSRADTQRRSGPRQAARRARRSRWPTLPADEEFALVVTRRGADGAHEAVAIVDDEALVERADPPRRLTLTSAAGLSACGGAGL